MGNDDWYVGSVKVEVGNHVRMKFRISMAGNQGNDRVYMDNFVLSGLPINAPPPSSPVEPTQPPVDPTASPLEPTQPPVDPRERPVATRPSESPVSDDSFEVISEETFRMDQFIDLRM